MDFLRCWLREPWESNDLVRLLLQSGADISKCRCRRGNTLFSYVISHDERELLRILLDEGITPNFSESDGMILSMAFSRGNEEQAKILLEAGADPYAKSGFLRAASWYIEKNPAYMKTFGKYLEEKEVPTGSMLAVNKQVTDPRLHTISVHKGSAIHHSMSRIPVQITDSGGPITLLLNSCEPVEWANLFAPDIFLEEVYLAGRP